MSTGLAFGVLTACNLLQCHGDGGALLSSEFCQSAVLGIESRSLQILEKRSTAESQPNPQIYCFHKDGYLRFLSNTNVGRAMKKGFFRWQEGPLEPEIHCDS